MNESRTFLVTLAGKRHYVTPQGIPSDTVFGDVASCESSRSGSEMRNWRERLRQCINATTPFTAEMNILYKGREEIYICLTKDPDPESGRTTSSVMTGNWSARTLNEPSAPTALDSTTANNEALKRIIVQANSVQRSIQGGVVLGELGEALRMIRNPARAFRRGLDSYLHDVKKRGDKAAKATRSKHKQNKSSKTQAVKRAISDSWLEHSFGWLPLLNDVRDGAKALARLNYMVYPPREIVRASAVTESVTHSPQSFSGFNHFVNFDRQTRASVSVQYVAAVKTAAPNARVFEEFGLVPSEFLPTVWELIPWSFLADYFTNIGDIVAGYSYNRSQIAWMCKTVRLQTKQFATGHTFNEDPVTGQVITVYVHEASKPTWIRKHVQRSNYTGTVVPDLEFSIPGMGTKWINLSALALSSRSRSRELRRLIS